MADARRSLEALLKALGESSQFVSSGSLPPVLSGLEINDVGTVGSPISAEDAKRLIAKATQAPYGRGEQTIVDPNVRRVWQIEPAEFRLENSEWHAHVAAIVDTVKEEFGIQQKVKAELYKLLIYEPGSFFAPHRDTEKSHQMFATLVVCLPSRHAGGALIVRHDGQTKRIDFGAKESQFKTQYAAFYADCQHEIEAVKSGHRICLIYNLATVGKQQPAAPQNAETVSKAADLLRALFADKTSELDKIAIPFEHQYSAAGLNPAHLKGSDSARADVLVRVAESLDYACYFALLTHWQSGSPDYSTMDYDPYQRRSSYRWSDHEDEEDGAEGTSDDSGVEMEEVCDEDLSLDHWLNPRGNPQPFGEIHLDDNEILTSESREGWSRKQEISEATGNAGASMERWYRQGAIVIWPRDHTFRILAGEGQRAALPELEKLLVSSKTDAELTACHTFANEIVNHWQPRQNEPNSKSVFPRRMLAALERIGCPELAERFVRDVLPKDFDGSEGKTLLRLCQKFGWASLGTALRRLIEQQKPADYFALLQPIVALCRPLCSDPPPLTDDRRAVCEELADALANAIEQWDKKAAAKYVSDESRAGVIDGVVHIFASISAEKRLDCFLNHVLADNRRYDLHQILIPDLKAIHQWLPEVPAARTAAASLLEHCMSELRTATAHTIEPPADWAREAKLDCKCEDCQALSRFLRDPQARVGRFPIRKERRQHLHQQIDEHRCDCTHVTERKGSPQTLVCTKTQATYERRLQQYKVDLKLLAELKTMANSKEENSGEMRSNPISAPKRKPKTPSSAGKAIDGQSRR